MQEFWPSLQQAAALVFPPKIKHTHTKQPTKQEQKTQNENKTQKNTKMKKENLIINCVIFQEPELSTSQCQQSLLLPEICKQ